MNNDGIPDIITGKRFWAHGEKGDAEPDAPAMLLWLECKRDRGNVRFVPHVIDDDSGVGTQVVAARLSCHGLPDVLTSNKKGTYVHQRLPHRPVGARIFNPRTSVTRGLKIRAPVAYPALSGVENEHSKHRTHYET
jgi:hypothetical protein